MPTTPVSNKRNTIKDYFSPVVVKNEVSTEAPQAPDEETDLQEEQPVSTGTKPTKRISLRLKLASRTPEDGTGTSPDAKETTTKSVDVIDDAVDESSTVPEPPKRVRKKRDTYKTYGARKRKRATDTGITAPEPKVRPPTGRPRGRPRKDPLVDQEEDVNEEEEIHRDERRPFWVDEFGLPSRTPRLEDFDGLFVFGFPVPLYRYRRADQVEQDGVEGYTGPSIIIKREDQNDVDNEHEARRGALVGVPQPGRVLIYDLQREHTVPVYIPDNVVVLLNRKRTCLNCGQEQATVLVNNNQNCNNCNEIMPPSTLKRNGRQRPPWEDLGLKTFWDINQETGHPEERVVIRKGKMPDTPGFAMDLFMARQASESDDPVFKRACLKMIQMRQANDIPKMTINNRFNEPNDNVGVATSETVLMFGKNIRVDKDGFFLQDTNWDHLLDEMKIKSKKMRFNRQWRTHGKGQAAGWAIWETRMRRESRGEFVNADPPHSWVVHESGLDGGVTKDLQLEYKRKGIDRGDGVFEHVQGKHWVESEVFKAELAQRQARAKAVESEEAIVDEDDADAMDIDEDDGNEIDVDIEDTDEIDVEDIDGLESPCERRQPRT